MPAITLTTATTPSVQAAEGSFLCLGNALPATSYIPIANCVDIGGPKRSVAEVATTNLLSPAKTYRPGKIPEPGDLDFTLQFDPADTTHLSLESLAGTPALMAWALVFAIGSVGSRPARLFNAFVKSFEIQSLEDEANITVAVSLKLSGTVTIGTA